MSKLIKISEERYRFETEEVVHEGPLKSVVKQMAMEGIDWSEIEMGFVALMNKQMGEAQYGIFKKFMY